MLMLTAQIFQTENLTQPWEDPDYCLKHQIKKVECNYSFSTKSDSSRIFRKDSEIYEIDERGRFTAQLYFFGGVISNAWRIVYDSTLSPASTYTYYFGALKTEAEKVSPQLTVKKLHTTGFTTLHKQFTFAGLKIDSFFTNRGIPKMVVTEISRKCFLSRKKRFEVQTNNFETQVSKKNIFYVWYRKNGSLRKKKIGPATTYYCYRNNLLVEKKVLDENKLSEKTIFQYDKQGLLRKTITISEKTNTITRKTVNYEFYSR